MKIIDNEMLKQLKANCKIKDENDDNFVEKKEEDTKLSSSCQDISYLQEFDKAKTKVLKYVCYKKRTEREVLDKFSGTISNELLKDVIENLKENNYIDDNNYIDRAVNEFISLNNLSIKEIRYKLYSKGINSTLIENYFSKNIEILLEYEINSAKNIAIKKRHTMDDFEITNFLRKKGYSSESIKEAINELK